MDNRLVKVLGGLAAFGLVLLVGAVVGGVLVYGLIQLDPLTVAQAQAGDPGYGFVIARVEADSPAADAGVVRADILLEIDGEALDESVELRTRVSEYEPGDEVELTVLHGDDLRTLTAVVGEREDEPYLGVSPCMVRTTALWLDTATAGAAITEVLPDSPAEEAGLAVGDVILAVGSERMDAGAELAEVIAGFEVGDSVTLEIQGPVGGPRKVTVKLGEHPEEKGLAYLGVRYSAQPEIRHFGWGSPPLDEEEHLEPLPFPLPQGETFEGLVVLDVAEDSPASEAGLEVGDIIKAVDGEEMTTAEELAEIVANSKPGGMMSLTVGRVGTTKAGEVDVILGEDPDEEGKPYLGVTLWPVPHLGSIEGEFPPLRRYEEFEFDELPFSLPQGVGVQGAVVLSVEQGSPADVAGLGKGDVITAFDGEPLQGAEGLVDAIAGLEPGDKLGLTVIEGDGDAEREIEVTLGEHPDEKGKAYLGVELGSYHRMERRGEYRWPRQPGSDGERFRFGLPLDDLPFNLDELPHWFDFHWTPNEGDCEGSPGCFSDSV